MKKSLHIFLVKALMIISVYALVPSTTMAQSIEHTYHFNNPTIEDDGIYQRINFDGCILMGKAGEPALPWQNVSLLLPLNSDASDIIVEFSDFTELEGTYNLLPYQNPRPVSDNRKYPFERNERIYQSADTYPSETEREVNTQYLNGCSFAFSSFTPVRYVPASGKISYAQTVKVKVKTTASRTDNSANLWLRPEIQRSVERLAQNPEQIEGYKTRARSIGGYDLLVITPSQWVSSFNNYKNFYDTRGIRTTVVSVETIYSTMSGTDNQEKIRNYIIQQYQNNGIMMVLLGGDVALVPYRGLYCYIDYEYNDNIPADMYYAGLDGNWNNNGNSLWGENGEEDFLPEIGIGRMCFSNSTELNNLLNKTLTYQNNPVLGEFTTVNLGGEQMDETPFYAGFDLDHLIGTCNFNGYTTYGIPSNYTINRYYASNTTTWNANTYRQFINEGGSYNYHMGHASTSYVAGWETYQINDSFFGSLNGTQHNYSFFNTQGCECGNFPDNNCILTKLTTTSTGFVATIGNSRYGWYSSMGDGPGAHFQREYADASYHERIPYIGLAVKESKIQYAPYANTSPYYKWTTYDINIMGDVATSVWLEEPFTPNVNYVSQIPVGTNFQFNVTVTKNGQPLSNFRCSLYRDTELLGFGVTNSSGAATLNLDPITSSCVMDLIVTGPNAWTQHLTVTAGSGTPEQLTLSITSQNPTCNGDDGYIIATPSGGIPPYTYRLNGEVVGTPSSNSMVFQDLDAGNYSVQVTDAVNTTVSENVTLSSPEGVNITDVFAEDPSCHGFDDGSITIQVDNGNTPYTYTLYSQNNGSWEHYDNGINTDAIGLTDGGSFSWGIMFPFSNLPESLLTKVSMYDYTEHTGEIKIYQGGYSSPGTLIYTQSYSCTGSEEYVEFTLNTPVTIDVTQNLWIIMHNFDGHYVASGGNNTGDPNGRWISTDGITWNDVSALGFDLTWNLRIYITPITNITNNSNTYTFENLSPDNYTITVTDANDCSDTETITINEPSSINISGTTTDASCHDSNDGNITLNVNGGTSPYTYSWSNGATTANINNLSAGSYIVTVTDFNGCTASESFTVNAPEILTITGIVTNVSSPGGNDGSITINVNGGTPPYTYTLNDVPTTSFTGLSAGTYTIVVTDANGCTDSATFIITEEGELNPGSIASTGENLCVDEAPGQIPSTMDATTTNSNLTYRWKCNGTVLQNSNVASYTPEQMPAGSYIFTREAMDSNTDWTESIGSWTVTVSDNPVVTIDGNLSIEEGESTTLTASGAENYIWDTGETTASITVSPTETTTYSVIGINGDHCIDIAEVTVEVNLLGIDENANQQVNLYPNPTTGNVKIQCKDMKCVTIMTTTGQIVSKATIDSDETTINFDGLPAGIYIVGVMTHDDNMIMKRVTYILSL